jgi:uncharacterized protein (DUF433 family)
MEAIAQDSPLFPWISSDPDRLSGEPVFRGTRVPVRSLFEHLASDYTISGFLDQFEGVACEQVVAVLMLAVERLIADSTPRQ